ncbi:MAG: hypothetical protein HQK52_23295 [Oligoflexia bacterium]|nr:hypothetical protein [Oligoflexia bacterium]
MKFLNLKFLLLPLLLSFSLFSYSVAAEQETTTIFPATAPALQNGPVYNFQFYNSPPPPAVSSGTATKASLAPVTAPVTAPVVTPAEVANTNISEVKTLQSNNYTPAVGLSIIEDIDGAKTSPNLKFYTLGMKIPIGTNTSIVPKLLMLKNKDALASKKSFGTSVDLRHDYFGGKYFATGSGLSLALYKFSYVGQQKIQSYYDHNNYYFYDVPFEGKKEMVSASLFVAPNVTLFGVNIEASLHLGYKYCIEDSMQYSNKKQNNGLYTMYGASIGIAI